MKQQMKIKRSNTIEPKDPNITSSPICYINNSGIGSSKSLGDLQVSSIFPKDSPSIKKSDLGVNSPSIIPMVTTTTSKSVIGSNESGILSVLSSETVTTPNGNNHQELSSGVSQIENTLNSSTDTNPSSNKTDLSNGKISTKVKTFVNTPIINTPQNNSISQKSPQENISTGIVSSAGSICNEGDKNIQLSNVVSSTNAKTTMVTNIDSLEKNRLKAFNVSYKL